MLLLPKLQVFLRAVGVSIRDYTLLTQSKEQDPASELSAEKIHWNFKENIILPMSQVEQQRDNVARRMTVRKLNTAFFMLIKSVWSQWGFNIGLKAQVQCLEMLSTNSWHCFPLESKRLSNLQKSDFIFYQCFVTVNKQVLKVLLPALCKSTYSILALG